MSPEFGYCSQLYVKIRAVTVDALINALMC